MERLWRHRVDITYTINDYYYNIIIVYVSVNLISKTVDVLYLFISLVYYIVHVDQLGEVIKSGKNDTT